ncbi:MAG: hypothetical protein LUO89_09815 [Methanothrix sp.]|nr:hypothetical protein [Methanothrix sp.]
MLIFLLRNVGKLILRRTTGRSRIEILDASDFLASLTKISTRAASREAVEVES